MVELIEISDCLKAFKLMDVNSSFFEIDQNKLNYTIARERLSSFTITWMAPNIVYVETSLPIFSKK